MTTPRTPSRKAIFISSPPLAFWRRSIFASWPAGGSIETLVVMDTGGAPSAESGATGLTLSRWSSVTGMVRPSGSGT